jgi:RNA polymerase sigma-70 factor (ECF subfamily)
MMKLRTSRMEKGGAERMFFSRSIAFDEEGHVDVVSAADGTDVFPSAEARFIEKLKAGNADAFDALVGRHAADVYALLFRLTENAEEACDLTQETFLSALTGIKGFRGEAGLRTWLFRIAINHSRNRFRWWKRRKRDVTVSLDATIGDGAASLHETLPDKGRNPEDGAIANERERAVLGALREMPDVFREAIVLCDLEGLSYEEISAALGVNIGTVKSRIARGREDLRKRLKDF